MQHRNTSRSYPTKLAKQAKIMKKKKEKRKREGKTSKLMNSIGGFQLPIIRLYPKSNRKMC